MNILFLERGHLWRYGLPDGLRELGHAVRMSGVVTRRSLTGWIRDFKPHLFISVGWGPDQTKEKQLLIRSMASRYRIPLVYWSTEDPNFTDVFTLPLMKRMKPDYTFTISGKAAARFRKLGYSAKVLDFGFHPRIHKRVKPLRNYRSDIAVVANAYPDVLAKYPKLYRRKAIELLIRPIVKSGMSIRFYGRNWERMKPYLGQQIPGGWIKGPIAYKDAYKVYSSAKLIIGLQNYTDMATQRTYEVLGSSGLLLTTDTPGVRKIVKSGVDALLTRSAEETLKLARYYLSHPQERERVRRQGRITIAKHHYRLRAAALMKELKKSGVIR
ncbi:glycosyltransferase [Paenibacillus sp. NEAU-GSW1]|uniref:CgeB family protein n=1 Tax=Paenibacillus sp. NEAU-GSW1 TaxID=2682486 RepID=UPI0012E23BE9|nr:glycosyltransferase [Paenibacillus sp. NEAU-GSW1]MUT67084.1 glycosyltransferase [Paenibacillus sp. NEAU-GSW1]